MINNKEGMNNMGTFVRFGSPTQKSKKQIYENYCLKTPLWFEALEDGNIKLTKNGSPSEISLIYSLDNENWLDWDYSTGTNLKARQKLYLKAKTSQSFSKTMENCYIFSSTNRINVCGNIMSLIYNNFQDKNQLIDNGIFSCLFEGCDKLIDASELKLPATSLTNNCYFKMFYNCSSLLKAPELQALELRSMCYAHMFSGCKKLEYTPTLPALDLDTYCYCGMFSNCTSLTETPIIPARKTEEACYHSMFSGCSKLKGSINLPATTITKDCYIFMFSICTSLNEIHYPSIIENDLLFKAMTFSPKFGATNATIHYDL